MNLRKHILKYKKLLKYYLYFSSFLFTIFIFLSFTSLPFWMFYYLGASSEKTNLTPKYIIVMGGGGMPSETGLIRTYFAKKASTKYPNSKIIIALPGDTSNCNSAIYQMKVELVNRNVNSYKIIFEPNGKNTRSQALEIKKMISTNESILIITSPEHIYRAVKTFKKVGFKNIGGKAAFEKAIEAELNFDGNLGGNDFVPNIGSNTQLRYQFWNHMKLQIIVYREYLAIVYYKLKGWI